MKKQISVLLVVLLLLFTALPASAETTAKPIPFSGWSQEEEGTSWPRWIENSEQIAPYFGQAYLCQTKNDLTALLQTNPEYGDGYDEAFFAEKSLLLLEVYGPQLNDKWYVKNLAQDGTALIAEVVFEGSPMGPDAIYSKTLCVELNEKPVDMQTLVVNITYEGVLPRDPATVEFYYEPAATEPVVEPTYGDVDGDGTISAADALLILKAVVGKAELTETQQAAADFSFVFYEEAEHKVDTADALLILQKVTYSGPFKHVPPIF